MSNEDPYRPEGGRDYGRDRGAYTPPTDDDLPFDCQGYDPRRAPPPRARGSAPKGPPVTLIISAVVLLALIVAVALYYRSGPRASSDAPPAIGTPVDTAKADAPIDAQPIDPEAGIDVYAEGEAPTTAPVYAPEPEPVQPRPAPSTVVVTPTPTPVTPAPTTRPPVTPPVKTTAPPPPAAGGAASVQIGAFSTPTIADNEYALVLSRFPQLTRGGSKRVQEVTASNGSTVYRTTVTGLSRDGATRLCDAIRAAGDDCFVR